MPDRTPTSPFTAPDEGIAYLVSRLWNPGRSAGGTNLPPRQVAGQRVPYPSGLKVVGSEAFTGGTTFIVSFIEPQNLDASQIDRYDFYALVLAATPPVPLLVGSTQHSPAVCRVNAAGSGSYVALRCRTVLKNGFANSVDSGPSCTGITLAPP